MADVHVFGGWWMIFFFLPFFFWRRGWRHGPDPRAARRAPELDEGIRARLELVDQLETRVAELENRLDFAERLLAERREARLDSH
jgi:uncharacterized protein (DUF342 family)